MMLVLFSDFERGKAVGYHNWWFLMNMCNFSDSACQKCKNVTIM